MQTETSPRIVDAIDTRGIVLGLLTCTDGEWRVARTP
jgi:hypothetical protein